MHRSLIMILGVCLFGTSFAGERDVSEKWCKNMGGKAEYRLSDKTRIDCVLEDEFGILTAIEFEWNYKIFEAVGQSVFYARKLESDTGQVAFPAIIFIRKENGKALNKGRFLTAANGLIERYLCITENGKKEEC